MIGRRTQGISPPRPAHRGKQEAGVSIDRLSLRLPGASAAFGRRVAERVVERVARDLPAGVSGRIEALQLNVRAPDLSEEGLTQSIARSVLAALERRRS